MSRPDLELTTLAGADPHDYLAYDGAADVTDRFERYLEAGNFRGEWLHVARRGGAVVARAAFWGRPGATEPAAIDHFDMRPGLPDPVEVGAALLRSVYATRGDTTDVPDLHMFLPPRWRETPAAAAIRDRVAAAERAGLEVLVERHRLEHVAGDALPDDIPALTYAAAPADDDLLVELLRRISVSSLDAGTVRSVDRLGPDGAARSYLADMDALPGDRTGWLVGHDADGRPVGLVIATAETSPYPSVAFVGVDPDHRGRDYGRALLVEATRRLVAGGADRIRADTDITNAPTVSVFDRAGWRPWATRLVMHRPA